MSGYVRMGWTFRWYSSHGSDFNSDFHATVDDRAAILPKDLLARARELDAEHHATIGRPISRDTLRGQARIGRDRRAPSSP
jgi:predicted dithiol-disulfide oxidoreductase (DUF899 family)